MKKPEVVVFDLGKVLVDFDYGIAARKIAERAKLSAPDVQRALDHSPLLFQFETNRISTPQFFGEVCAATGYRGTLEEFVAAFADIFAPIPKMIDLHARLREEGVPTYIFSNTNDIAVSHIRRRFPFFARFDDYVLSYEEGLMKPEEGIYQIMEDRTGRTGEQILYLDDRPENVDAGRKRRWRVILQQSPESTIEEVVRLGLVEFP